MTGNTDMHLLVTDTIKNDGGMDKKCKKSESGVTSICLMRLLIVACGMLSHSSSMAVQSYWILSGT
jgi:hypothetical protein